MNFFLRYLVLYILLFLSSCASIGSPSGGKEDKSPPKLVTISPENRSYIENNQTIKLSFNERINSQNVNRYIRVEPDSDVYIKVTNNEIILKPRGDWPNYFKIFISRKLEDYHNNSLIAPIELLFSRLNLVDGKKVSGQLYNIEDSKIYEVAIIDMNNVIVSKTESDSSGNFSFSGITKLDSLFILAIENKITENFINDIRNYRYGISNKKLSYNFNSIYISEPIFRAKINNITQKNKYFGEISLSNGNKIPFILNNSQFSENIYQASNYIYLETDYMDSLFLDIKYQNSIEEYNIKSSVLLYDTIKDSLPPILVEKFISNDSLLFRFDEPVSISKNMQVFSYINQDSLENSISFNYISPDLILLDKIGAEDINVNCDGIKDLNNNSLCDSLLIISKNSIVDNGIQSSLGIVNGNIIYNGNKSLVVEIINISNNDTIKKIVKENQFMFTDLLPGEYKIWVYENINTISNNYFSGMLEPQVKEAAQFNIYKNQLTVRGNWSNTITINLE